MTYASIPSPATSVWHLGFLPIRAYALCIVVGIIVAAWITERRMRARGAPPWVILDVVVWAVPAGIIGARIYHVITSPKDYFGAGGDPVAVLYIWNGGLGIWGAVAGGALGVWLGCRRIGIPLSFVADCLAPALPVAQAIGRFGNWFNNELYGRSTALPWGLKVHASMVDGKAVPDQTGQLFKPGLYQPTFLYEVIWDLGVALLVYLLDRKYKFGRGRAFALYVMAYTAGRAWIEYLRIDEANHFLGLRINDWVALVVFIGALIYFLRVRGPQLILTPKTDETKPTGDATAASEEPAGGEGAGGGEEAEAEVEAGEDADVGQTAETEAESPAEADADADADAAESESESTTPATKK